jgi:hypothetical protein
VLKRTHKYWYVLVTFLGTRIYWPKGPLIQILCGNYPLFQKHVPNFGPFKSFLGKSLVPDLSTSYNSNRPASIKNHQKLTQNLSGGLAALLHYPKKKKKNWYLHFREWGLLMATLNPRNVKLGLMNPHFGLSVGLFRSNLNGFWGFYKWRWWFTQGCVTF